MLRFGNSPHSWYNLYLEHLLAPLSFSLLIVAKLLFSCLCLYRWVTSYGENLLNDFLIGNWKWIRYVIKVYLYHDFYCVYVVKTFITWNWKALYKYTSPFSSLLRIHLFFFINFLYRRGLFSERPTHIILVSNEESTPKDYGDVMIRIIVWGKALTQLAFYM